MIQATELGFAKREENGISYVGRVCPGRFINDKVYEGDEVTLKKSGRTVLVDRIKHEGTGFIGTIYGLEPPGKDTEFEGVRIGDDIYFSDSYIFTCRHLPGAVC